MCVDFTDLNKACPKDSYPLPRIDLLVDSTSGYELLSMLDASQGVEGWYSLVEKLVLALVTAARKLRPYFLTHPIIILTSKPLGNLLQKGTGSRMIKWSYELNEFELDYRPRTAIKAQALADFLVEYDPEEERGDNYQKEWTMDDSNNEAEYETLLVGLNLAQEEGAEAIEIKSDSQLVVEQVTGGFESRTPEMKKLKEEVLKDDVIQAMQTEPDSQRRELKSR
ncbi:UNVERIFIED_CONTAM: hypothetical protein Sradi_3285800 [Sesamum radiatum]|uniref:RNase H type-1 domain-containing protein n=1 Tax=Sesamum radiatum TaxID=300843 RepID=A0AAW2R0W5_SESRA